MTFSSVLRSVAECCDRGRGSGSVLPQSIIGGAAVAGIALACSWVLWANLVGNAPVINEPNAPAVAQKVAKLPSLANAYVKFATAMRSYARQTVSSQDYASLLDPRTMLRAAESFSTGTGVETDGRLSSPGLGRFTVKVAREISSTIKGADRLVEKSADRLVEKVATAALPSAAPENHTAPLATEPSAPAQKPSIFERLFGKVSPLTLAYASTDDDGLGEAHGELTGRYDRLTAVYDISAHTVYMPDGTKLEAHSGRDSLLDDPRHVDQKNRGATPPDVYDLALRESPFHGVQAIRLIPFDERKVFGRSGLLAHTYMFGPNGDSFGCVSFKNYNAFLLAYLNHKIKRLVVVAGPV